MSLPGYDDWLTRGDYAEEPDAYGENFPEEDMNYHMDTNNYGIKTTAELEPGDMLELLGDPVFDDEFMDDPELSPWNYEFGVVAEVGPSEEFEGAFELTLNDGTGVFVTPGKKWKVVE